MAARQCAITVFQMLSTNNRTDLCSEYPYDLQGGVLHRKPAAAVSRKPSPELLATLALPRGFKTADKPVSLTSAKKVSKTCFQKKGRDTHKQAPGPLYIPPSQLRKAQPTPLQNKAIKDRVAILDLARVPSTQLVEIYIKIKLLPDLSKRLCEACGEGKLELKTQSSRARPLTICGVEVPPLEQPLWRCNNPTCQQRYPQLDPDGPLEALFGKGCVNPARTLLALAHIVSHHATGYCSSSELATHAGLNSHAAQRICDIVRGILAQAAKNDQRTISWEAGSLLEADEASMRVKRVPCPKGCALKSCGGHENGRYRLLYYRYLAIMPRGRRDLAKFFELPHKTCAAGGAGVPLGASECDRILSVHLAPGPYTLLTDGAGAYQSVAPHDRVAYHTEDVAPHSFSRERFEKYYQHLNISHGIVSHDDEQWAVPDKLKVVTPAGRTKTIALKKGTQCVDGAWPEVRGSIPHAVHTSDWERCQAYIWAWVWKSRRQGKDLLQEFGAQLGKLRRQRRQS